MQVATVPSTWHMVTKDKTRAIREILRSTASFAGHAEEFATDIWALRMLARTMEINIEIAQKLLDELGMPRVEDQDACHKWRVEHRQPVTYAKGYEPHEPN